MESASNKQASVTSKISLKYHDIFNYPLTIEELKKWKIGPKFLIFNSQFLINKKSNFYFINKREKIVKKRLQNEKYSKKKLVIAKKAANLISKIPTVSFIGVTGSLAMMNSNKNSDIDLIIITKPNTLWNTRLICYLVIWFFGYKIRKPNNRFEKDKLCLNMWLDEANLVWDKKDRNIYTAHEIAQIIPLVNKNNNYENFLYLNRWILSYWPNAVSVQSTKFKVQKQQKLSIRYSVLGTIFEKIAFKLQYFYMRNKITTEIVTPSKAIFHKNDWGKVVMKKLSS